MADYLTTDSELTSIANAIRTKGGTSAALAYPTEFIQAIEAIETIPDTQTKTVNPSESTQTVTPDSGKLLSAVTVTAVSSNYVGSNISRKATATYTPGTVAQTIAADQYLTGVQIIAGDTALVASNIADDTTIFGVTGTLERATALTTAEIFAAVQSGWI